MLTFSRSKVHGSDLILKTDGELDVPNNSSLTFNGRLNKSERIFYEMNIL
jgi:hypothetical protein